MAIGTGAGATDPDVVVEPHVDGYRVSRGGTERVIEAPALPAEVRRLEEDRPRWVWDTARVYPVLLEAGVRVERGWDLRLARAVLRRAPGVEASFAERPPDAWDDPAAAPAHDLLPIDLEPPSGAVDEAARQRGAVASSGRAPALRLLITAESAGALAAAEMRSTGLPWRRDEHERLLVELLGPRVPPGERPRVLERLAAEVRTALGSPTLNPDSAAEVVRTLGAVGVAVDSTRASELRGIDHPAIAPLLEYKRLARLHAANGWHWLDTWVADGRFRPDYVVGGVVTGRWATRGGGALQLPKQVRGAVIADPGRRFVVADAAQLEPRVLAGLSHDTAMAAAGRDRDLYDGVVASGAVTTRAAAKIGMLAALYGATRGESGRLVPRLAQRFPRALALVEAAAREGERGGTVHTLLGRGSPPPSERQRAADRDASLLDAGEAAAVRARSLARDRGRFTRNFVVQGTAAEWALCWLADLRRRLWALSDGALAEGPHLVYFLHDEVIVHTPEALADRVADEVRRAAAAAGRLLFGDFPVDFPLDVSIVDRYSDAG